MFAIGHSSLTVTKDQGLYPESQYFMMGGNTYTSVTFTALSIPQSFKVLVAQLHDVTLMQSLCTTTLYLTDICL